MRATTMIFGHDTALSRLRGALRRARPPHAWIFHGPFGVGKCTVAMELARLMLDAETVDEHIERFKAPRGTEDARLIDAGTHPDLTVIRRELVAFSIDPEMRRRTARNIPIGLLREHLLGGMVGERPVDGRVAQSAARGRGRVFIIDEAELLEHASQNALLKTLEEPPAGVTIILSTTRPDRLLPTIHSRCERLAFAALDPTTMEGWMKAQMSEVHGTHAAGSGADHQRRRWLIEFAAGSPGRALFAVRHGLHEWTAQIASTLDDLGRGRAPREPVEGLEERIDALADALLKERKDALSALRPAGTDQDDEADGDDDQTSTSGGTGAGPGAGKFTESKVNVKREAVAWLVALLADGIVARMRAALDGGDDPERWAAMLDLLVEAETTVHANVQPKWALADFVARAATLPMAHALGAGR